MAEFFLLLALVPSLTLTDSEHFLLALPLISFLIYSMINKKVSTLLVVFIMLGLLLYGGNIHDLLGSKLSGWVEAMGFLGIGNLLLISFFYALNSRKSS